MNKKLKTTLKKYDKSKQNKETLISGELGVTLGGSKVVEVPGRQGFVYVRLKGNTSELIQAYNATVSPVYDLPVFVVRQTGIYKVVGRNIDRYQNQFGLAPYLPKHGAQHSFNQEIGAGGDVVWIYPQQFMPMLSYPSGTAGAMTLSIEPHFYEWNGSWKYLQNTGTPSYTPYLPTITGSARMVLSYIDPTDNSIKLVPGTPFANTITGSADIAQYIPDIPREIGIPLAAVRLTTGTTTIDWGAIYDMRDFFTTTKLSGSVGGGGGGAFGVMTWDEGVPLITGSVLNFVGGGITATASGTVVNVSVGSVATLDQADPYEIHHRSTGTNSFDDEFSGNTLSSYTAVTPAGTATWTMARSTLGVQFTNQAASDVAVFVKSLSLADGEWIETCFRTMSENRKNYTFAGLVLTDGVSTTSNCICASVFQNQNALEELYVRMDWGTITNLTTAGLQTTLSSVSVKGAIRLRLIRTSSTAYSWSLALENGLPFYNWGVSTVNPGFTPTYAGVLVSTFGNAQNAIASFDYLRKYP